MASSIILLIPTEPFILNNSKTLISKVRVRSLTNWEIGTIGCIMFWNNIPCLVWVVAKINYYQNVYFRWVWAEPIDFDCYVMFDSHSEVHCYQLFDTIVSKVFILSAVTKYLSASSKNAVQLFWPWIFLLSLKDCIRHNISKGCYNSAVKNIHVGTIYKSSPEISFQNGRLPTFMLGIGPKWFYF